MSPHIRRRAIAVAKEARSEFLQDFNVGDNESCILCGARRWSLDQVADRSKYEIYDTVCPRRRCSSQIWCELLVVRFGDSIPIGQDEVLAVERSEDRCSFPIEEMVGRRKPAVSIDLNLAIESLAHTNLHQHHTSYDPERTVTVCNSCHSKVHKTDGYHDELIPKELQAMADD